MDTIEAARLARELMNQHKLFDWRFQFDRSQRRLGYCSFREKFISLSEPYTRINSLECIKDTILHEIAHAIAGAEAGHRPCLETNSYQRWSQARNVCR